MSARKKVTDAEPIKTAAVTEAPETEPAETAAAEVQEAPEAVVYLGPDIDRLVNHGTVFEGGELPEYLTDKIKEIPAIKGLIVPVSRYAEVAREITLPEGRFRTLYDTVKAKVSK